MTELLSSQVSQSPKIREFALYLDESGSQKPSPHDKTPFFAMGGILVERGNEDIIINSVNEFKTNWGIDINTPLHGTDIRSKKKAFRKLENFSQEELNRFHTELNNIIISCPITIHACVISRTGYLKRFEPVYGSDTWEMMKSSFSILVERAAKYVQSQGGRMMVYFEEIGKNEDRKIKAYFKDLRSQGHPFNEQTASIYSPYTAQDFSSVLLGIEGKKKKNVLLQLADFCLHPIADVKVHPTNRAYAAFLNGNIIVDCHLQPDNINVMGIKYYCY